MQGQWSRRDVRRGEVLGRACVAIVLVSAASVAGASGIDITAGGGPSYSAAITVPPGIAGVAPSLAVSYTGSGSSGPLGYGWSLQATSVITRCQGAAFTSGKVTAVAFSTVDRLCLDGQRLIQTNVSGVPTAANASANGALQDSAGRAEDGSFTEYRTEKDSFSRIRAYGMANGALANGPRYFKVWTKSGSILEFGAGPSADGNTRALVTASGQNIAVAWALARSSDTLGNYADYKYNQRDVVWGSGVTAGTPITGHEWNLVEIQYTGAPSQPPSNKIVFEYADRADAAGAAQDRSEAYHKGSKTLSVQRLSAIRSYINWPGPALGVAASPSGTPLAPPSTAVKVKTTKFIYGLGPNTARSRLEQIQECVGATDSTCMPATVFGYSAGTTPNYVRSTSFALNTTPLITADGKMGVLVADFSGDGRSDILRWSDTPGQNALWVSTGGGNFSAQSTSLTNADDNLFKSDGCYTSMLADFNGDGKSDLLRIMRAKSNSNVSCGTQVNRLYLSTGDGTFTEVPVPASIDFTQLESTRSTVTHCGVPNFRGAIGNSGAAVPNGVGPGCQPGYIKTYTYSRTAGSNFYVLDVNGDGLPDIVTSSVSAYTDLDQYKDTDYGCGTCTHVYLGSSSGAFTELTTTNVAHHSLYATPMLAPRTQYGISSYVVDTNGDGLSDLQVDEGTWQSNGDGNFTFAQSSLTACANQIDFNGDGRMDCLFPNPADVTTNQLYYSDGSSLAGKVANFNLVSAGQELLGNTLGNVPIDLDGDGRTDLIRWKDDPTQNVAYLSNGDGTFRAASAAVFNLNTADYALKKSDGTKDFFIGDFTGDGNVEILRAVAAPSGSAVATTNQLFVKAAISQPEQLNKVTTSSGIVHNLTWVTLSNSVSGSIGARYHTSATPATFPLVDATLPLWVVATVESQTGVGSSTVKTEYAYTGLRLGLDGRGMLGFGKVAEQHVAPDGGVTRLETNYLQSRGYEGSAGVVQSYDAGIGAAGHLLSETTNSYCDTTSIAAPQAIGSPGTAPTPCASTALVQRPYVYQTVAEGWDIDAGRTALPTLTTTNVYDSQANPTSIVAKTTGMVAGTSRTSTKTVTNTYGGDDTSGDHWIIGRLLAAQVRNQVTNALPQIATSAGTASHASDRSGPTPPVNVPAVMSAIVTLLLGDN